LRVLLPEAGRSGEELNQALRKAGHNRSSPAMEGLARQVTRFLEGEEITFPLEILAWDRCSAFQQRVLRAEHAIPRGWVSTYGRIAEHLGKPGAARAVGRALARNPFPILIPCHRAVRNGGELGGYQGGQGMKRALLGMEGVAFSPDGKVVMDQVYYRPDGE
jgi:methylated-DNA-[protein]-cysteine S-methyltransferase